MYNQLPNMSNVAWNVGVNNNARLYLFGPKTVPDITTRSYQYNISTGFYDFLDRATEIARNKIDSSFSNPIVNGTVKDLYVSDAQVSDFVQPVSNGVIFSGQNLSYNWTFLLLVDNAVMQGRANTYNSNNRLIYSGFVVDEPCVYSTLYGTYVPNPQAIFHFTSFSKINIYPKHGGVGNKTMSRPEVINDILSNSYITDDRNYYGDNSRNTLLRPTDLLGSPMPYENNHDEYMQSFTVGERLDAKPGELTNVSSDYGNPRYHGSRILSNIVQMETDHTYKNLSRDMLTFSMEDQFETPRNSFVNRFTDSPHGTFMGIDTTRPWFLQELLNTYESLTYNNWQNIDAYPDIQFNHEITTNGSAPTPINIGTTLLQQSIPGIIRKWGLSTLAFRYATYETMMGDQEEIALNYAYSQMSTDTEEMVRSRAHGCIKVIAKDVLSILKQVYGNFDVSVSYTYGDDSVIQLQLPDYTDIVNKDALIFNDVLATLATPIVGSQEIALGNTNTLEALAGFCAEPKLNLSNNYSNTNHHGDY